MIDVAILRRIQRASKANDALDLLTRGLSPSDLQSLLMHVLGERSAQRTPAELLAQYERATLFGPSAANPMHVLGIESAAFESAPEFEPVELSPVAPLGINRVLGEIDQNNCLAALRGAEVLADPTTLQALECARRRRRGERGTIRLAARSRAVRLQPFDGAGFSPHFALFSLVSAGRAEPSFGFELGALAEHLRASLGLLARLGGAGYALRDVAVEVADTTENARRLAAVERELFPVLSREHPNVRFAIDPKRTKAAAYYRGLCLSIDARDLEGGWLNLADGGSTDWTARLLSNAKERLFVSGIGIELLVKRFRIAAE